MDRVLPGDNFDGNLSLSSTEILQDHNAICYGSDPGTVRDVWSRKFFKRTSSSAH